MHLSSPSPPQTPITTTDESHTTSVKSPLHAVEHVARPQLGSPSSSSQSPAPPTLSEQSPRHSTSTSMSAIHSKVQPNSLSQSPTTASISTDRNTSCLILPAPAAASSRRDQLVKVSSPTLDSGIVDPVSLPMKSRQSITPSFSFPGASSPAISRDRTFANTADSHSALDTESSTESMSGITSQQTPNVYINGLPPHCSEQDLFALARPFGDIKSVRTFTRHVSEKPTGYGFVLFSDLDSAQRCIEGLRKCRNLHPSFSKQLHRIPGTEYAQQNAVQSTDQDENSFKSRMEKLKDTSSTNLYVEGLPLSIDEESLAGLMRPYKIKSSRFFKTKLSNPPRIIAFVRLETRTAAEETIERLHGRMVRGWNDSGCRISVRFADSAEQRELRRAERTLKNGDQSPSRLTIAQAALLNLRGQELSVNMSNTAGSATQRSSNTRSDTPAGFNSSQCDPVSLPTSRSLPSKLSYAYGESSLPTSDILSPSEMDALLQSIHNGYEDGSLDTAMRGLALDNEYLSTHQDRLRALASAALLSPNPLPMTLPRGHTQARNGFTAAEELILEAHAQRLQLQAQLSQSSPLFEPMSTLGQPTATRGFDPASHESLHPPNRGMLYQDALPTISEDDFHAMSHPGPGRSLAPTPHEFQGLTDGCPPSVSAANTIFVRPPSRAVSIVPPPPDYEELGKRPKGHQHVQRPIGSKQLLCSTSSFSDRQSIVGESKLHPALLQVSTRSNNIEGSNDSNNINTSISGDKNNVLQHTYMYSHGDMRRYPEDDKRSCFRPPHGPHIYPKQSPKHGEEHPGFKEGLKSPSVVSPALTYSSRTPSTLSPATPFFGSFAGTQDAFEVVTMENEDVTERKLKAKVASK